MEASVAIGPGVRLERQLVLGSAVDVVEHAAREPPAGDGPEVLNGCHSAESTTGGVQFEATKSHDAEGVEWARRLRHLYDTEFSR
jgi:hypothetical protein